MVLGGPGTPSPCTCGRGGSLVSTFGVEHPILYPSSKCCYCRCWYHLLEAGKFLYQRNAGTLSREGAGRDEGGGLPGRGADRRSGALADLGVRADASL